jgi:hypothetical protein
VSIGLFFVSKNDLKIFSVKDYDLFSRERTEVLRRHHLWFVKKIPVSECYQLIIDVNLNVFQGLRKCIIDRDHFKIFGITIFNENIYYSFLIKFYDLSSII